MALASDLLTLSDEIKERADCMAELKDKPVDMMHNLCSKPEHVEEITLWSGSLFREICNKVVLAAIGKLGVKKLSQEILRWWAIRGQRHYFELLDCPFHGDQGRQVHPTH